jgi:hypothetical protein
MRINMVELVNLKITRTTDENIVWLKNIKMIFLKNIEMTTY